MDKAVKKCDTEEGHHFPLATRRHRYIMDFMPDAHRAQSNACGKLKQKIYVVDLPCKASVSEAVFGWMS